MDKEQLQTDLTKSLEQGELTLIKCAAADYQQATLTVLDILVNKENLSGIYVTVNKPSFLLRDLLDEHDIDPANFYFIDAISKEMHEKIEDDDRISFIKSPQQLTDISIVLTEAVQNMPRDTTFVFFDSLSLLTLYNPSSTIVKFASYLVTRLREQDLQTVVLPVKNDMNEQLIKTLESECGSIIEV